MKTKVAILTRNFSKIGGGAESLAVSMATAMLGECDITVCRRALTNRLNCLNTSRCPSYRFVPGGSTSCGLAGAANAR